MQIFWPVKAEYRVVYLDAAYQTTIIGRTKRDFVWVMARTPAIDPETFATLLKTVQTLGYDLSQLRIHEPMRSLQAQAAEANINRNDR
jgi:apolipoprotein D and lipocalin family protein